MPRTLRIIAAEEQALAAEKAALLARDAEPWPRQATVTLFASPEYMREQGILLGLDGDELDTFAGALHAVVLALSVQQDGSVTVLTLDGHRVMPGRGNQP